MMWEKGLNTPLSSSVGRLFDAVASLLGVCRHYLFTFENGKIDVLPLLTEMLSESDPTIAVTKFFHTLVEMIAVIYTPYDLPLVLSGGVFQNRVLLELVLERFPEAIFPNLFPPNDGGIALGQIVAEC